MTTVFGGVNILPIKIYLQVGINKLIASQMAGILTALFIDIEVDW